MIPILIIIAVIAVIAMWLVGMYNGFFGGMYFSRTNEFLSEHGEGEIDWAIE